MLVGFPPFISLFHDISEAVSIRAKSMNSGVRPLGALFQHHLLIVILCKYVSINF